jgi:hypothetical protein
MQRRIVGIVAVLVLAGWSAAAQAEDWQWPNLNPFKSSKPKSLARNVGTDSRSSWLPSWGSAKPQRGPTTWQKVQAAPGNMLNKTKETLAPLNPFRSEQPKQRSQFALGSSTSKKAETNDSWWPQWITSEPQKERPLSVTDWLDAPRPE